MSDGSRCPIREWCERMLSGTLAVILATAFATASYADQPGMPHSWHKEIGPDKKYVFVMQAAVCRWGVRKTVTEAELAQLPPRAVAQTGRAGSLRLCDPQQILWTKKASHKSGEVDANGVTRWTEYYEVQYADGVSPEAMTNARGVPYPVSGLYRNDGSTEPLWSVDWYSFSANLSDDGRYLIRPGPWASFFEQLAIAFYDRGVLLKEYRIGDLVLDRNSVSWSVSHFIWSGGGEFDQKSLRYRLKTLADDRYEFDATTGAIVSKISPPRPGRAAIVEYTNGTQATFAALFTCSTREMWSAMDSNVFYGQKSGTGPEPNATWIQDELIPFSEIRSLTRMDERDQRNYWSVSFLDGRTRLMEFNIYMTTFCNRDAKGVRSQFAVEKIRSIEFARDK